MGTLRFVAICPGFNGTWHDRRHSKVLWKNDGQIAPAPPPHETPAICCPRGH